MKKIMIEDRGLRNEVRGAISSDLASVACSPGRMAGGFIRNEERGGARRAVGLTQSTIHNPQSSKGFSIVSAVFLLVVLAFLGTAMVTFSINQQQTVALDVMGARAYQAARAGIEWGAYQVLRGGACAANQNIPAGTMGGTLSGFAVAVTCIPAAQSAVSATTGTVTVYGLTSTATQGTAGQRDYVERQMSVTIAQ